ncbi:hypothetical protein EYF80_039802 [Liparis tanakae]|uniref:Uncharacterized protein n=1 Tax=Liparis tanakae TaxID=230148 RepID=A0A4Z2GB96_9TELE|nr:hypothetical protein EYF80_039802 [Liparis tanakae]
MGNRCDGHEDQVATSAPLQEFGERRTSEFKAGGPEVCDGTALLLIHRPERGRIASSDTPERRHCSGRGCFTAHHIELHPALPVPPQG